MEKYVAFIDSLKSNISTFVSTPKSEWNKNSLHCVNGLAGNELRRLVDIKIRRDSGAFFTESELADSILQKIKPTLTEDSFVYDAACGAGNLLIAAQNYMKLQNSNINCEKLLGGTDIHDEFVQAAKLRLLTNALIKSETSSLQVYKEEKNKKYDIITADGLRMNRFYKTATHIFVNPPFNQITSKEKLDWAKGKVCAAALFIDKIIKHSNPNTSIIAILPDVLRSGTRYEKWRSMVESTCSIEHEELLGRFDKHADVDVYLLHLIKRERPLTFALVSDSISVPQHGVISELFKVCVGRVVDNRDKREGPFNGYVVSRGLEGWTIQKEILKKRRHKGEVFKGPLVVIKRTSRKEDTHRAVATIIHSPEPVYIDNHLIVLQPKSKTLRDCKAVLSILKDARTDKWLNDRIRCRHLTVKFVKEIPIWNEV